jgi:3-hydroxymyristoyl/3-hydroxydecanoyl-(acyl carrier protein) dehydratase
VQAAVVNQLLNNQQNNPGGFPRVLGVTGGVPEFQLELEICTELAVFRGHFPDNPILAGIVQLHWAASFARKLFNFDQVPTEIKRLKFKNVVQPPATLILTLTQTDAHSVQFEFKSADHSHSMGLLMFEPGKL